MSDDVVTSSDVAPKKVPTSFNDLNKEQLVAAALAFGTDETGNKEAIKADLLESGVTFDQYLEMFHPGEKVTVTPEPETFELPEPTNIEDWPDADEGGDEEVSKPVTVAATPQLAPADKYLIKFIGENPYFEFGTYKFSQDKPYGIMPAQDAQKALVSEPDKFRQAYPAELQEFYG
jgi:hypothetical protein